MLTSARHLIDERPEEDPTRHYFYHHCSMIRFLDETKGDLEQGFNHLCIHLDRTQPLPDGQLGPYPPPRHPRPPRNPLLLWEEDEFFYHMAHLLDQNHDGELANTCRMVRTSIMYLPEDARLLLNEGYLDPIDHFDYMGHLFPYIDFHL